MPRLQATNSKPGLQCPSCGESLEDGRCPICSARRARWTAYAIIGVLAVVAPILSIRLLQMRAPPEFALLPALLIGGYAFVRAIAMTGERRERNLFIQRVLWIGGFVSMLSFILFYLWLVWALRGG